MNALVINCSPVRTGATAEIVKIVSRKLAEKYGTGDEGGRKDGKRII